MKLDHQYTKTSNACMMHKVTLIKTSRSRLRHSLLTHLESKCSDSTKRQKKKNSECNVVGKPSLYKMYQNDE